MEGDQYPVISVAEIKTEQITDNEEDVLNPQVSTGSNHEPEMILKGKDDLNASTSDTIYMPPNAANVLEKLRAEQGVVVVNVFSNTSADSTVPERGKDLHRVATDSYVTCTVKTKETGSDGEKKFRKVRRKVSRCPICQREFLYSSHLKEHVRKHTGEKPFSCDICEKRFATAKGIQLHNLTHAGEKTHCCDICQKQFVHSAYLRRHMKTHTEEGHRCSVCDKRFSMACNLKAHMILHTDDKPYSCHLCPKSFSFSGNLSRHIRTHTGEKRHTCELCHKKFASSTNLKVHLQLHARKKLKV